MNLPYQNTSTPQPPWHLWGGTQSWALRGNPATGVLDGATFGNQIAKITYRRPETWAFWFGGRITGHNVQVEAKSISLVFDVMTGIGRSAFDTQVPPGFPSAPAVLPGFCQFDWLINPGVLLNPTNRKYVTQVRSPLASDGVADSWVFIDRLVGQDIQISAKLTINSFDAAGVNFVNAEASCYFAPLSHVRPDWFVENFLGEEQGGT